MKWFLIIIVGIVVIFPLISSAAVFGTLGEAESVFVRIVGYAFTFFWLATVVSLLYAAYLFVTAGDNTDKVSQAQKILLYTFSAAAIVLISTGIKTLVTNILRGR